MATNADYYWTGKEWSSKKTDAQKYTTMPEAAKAARAAKVSGRDQQTVEDLTLSSSHRKKQVDLYFAVKSLAEAKKVESALVDSSIQDDLGLETWEVYAYDRSVMGKTGPTVAVSARALPRTPTINTVLKAIREVLMPLGIKVSNPRKKGE